MPHVRRRTPLLILCVTMAACGPVIDSARWAPAAPATRSEDVRVYSTRLPACAYEELGVVRGSSPDRFSSLQDVLDGMREHAARMGGDALIQFSAGTNVSASDTPAVPPLPASVSVSSQAVMVAIVVRFTEPCPAESPARAPR